jgi:xylulokinase
VSGPFLGVDIGTASSKGVLVDPSGKVLATATRAHALSLPRPGWAEHDAEAIWWGEFVAICRELTAQAQAPVAAVGVSGIGPCVLPATAGGAPLRPAILYGIDTRAVREIDEQRERFGAEAVLSRCGSPLTSQAVGPKLAWLRRNEPEVWERTARFFMASSFLVHRLTGEYVLDHHSASQSVPLYDRAEGAWIEAWWDEIAPDVQRPRLCWPGEVAGEIHGAAASATGLRAGTPVVAGTVDAWAEAFSVGVTAPGDVMVMYGSTMFLVEVLDRPLVSEALWGTTGVRPGTHCFAAGMATSGSLTEWVRELTGGADFTTLTEEAASVPAGSNGLVVLPYFAGERTPLFDPDARGVVAGLTLRHGRADLYRSVLEATAYGVRHNVEAMAAAGGAGMRLVAVGGGTTDGHWAQIVSNVLGREQEIPAHRIGAAFGDAMLAAVALDEAVQVSQWNPITATVEPDPGLQPRYDELYGIFRELYPATRDAAHALAAMQRRSPATPGGG